jgi:hypothetical protein
LRYLKVEEGKSKGDPERGQWRRIQADIVSLKNRKGPSKPKNVVSLYFQHLLKKAGKQIFPGAQLCQDLDFSPKETDLF